MPDVRFSRSWSARSPRGARRSFSALLGWVGLALVAWALPAGAIERMEGPLPWRVGGRMGFTCDAATFPDSAGYHLEVYLRVPPATLADLDLDERGDARVQATVSLRGRAVRSPLESTQEFTVSAADTAFGQGRVVLFRFPVSPGPVRIEARLQDLQSRRGALATSRARTERSELRGELELPRPQAGRDISDLEFLWPVVGRSPGLAFVRDGQARLPNPDRLYGLYASTLEASFTARSKAGDRRPWHWVARVIDHSGAVVAQSESTATAGRFARVDVGFDLTEQPAGIYRLDARVWQEGDEGALQRRAAFSVGWSPDTWRRSPADVADDVHFLFEAREEERFITLQPGEQERMLEEFWRRRDPTPETATNESYLTFRQRVDLANERFSRHGIGRGMFSDMGRVFIRYGEPGEILHQVMPAGDETLSAALEEIIRSEHRVMGEVNQKGPGGDQRPYEIWIYEGDIPVPFDVDPADASGRLSRRRLLFLFVDEQGLGTYTLRYSTE